jgi:hypothetical protein
LLKRFTGEWIHNITIFEEPKYAYVSVKIKANEFDESSGDIIKDITWTIQTVDGVLSKIEYQEAHPN